jgi:hypothetical protein
MKNLIVADLKVLGSKIWIVPLSILIGFLLLILGYSITSGKAILMIPFMIMPTVTLILGYELMHLSDGNRIHYQITSLPSGKLTLVLQKYLMIFVLFCIGILTEYFLFVILRLLGGTRGYETLFDSVNGSLLGVLRVAIFVIPLFFLTKKTRKSFSLFLIWIFGMYVIHDNITLELLYAKYDLNKTLGLYSILIIICIVAIFLLKITHKNKVNFRQLLIIPVAVIFPISLSLVQEALNLIILYSVMIKKFPEAYSYAYKNWSTGANIDYFLIHFVISIILFLIALYLWKKENAKILIKNLSLILLLPVMFFAMENSLREFLHLFEILRTHNDPNMNFPIFSLSQYITFIPMLMVSIYYSKKFLTEGGK